PIQETLRDALYAEEVTRDSETAARQYEEILSRYRSQRDFAATALFRLAEVRRKQNRKDDAIKLYQQLITEFPSSETHVALSKDNLTALGIVPPSNGNAPAVTPEVDIENQELARIKELEKTSPDLASGADLVEQAINQNHLRVISYLLEKGFDPNRPPSSSQNGSLLQQAIYRGNLVICEMLIKAGAKTNTTTGEQPLSTAVTRDFPAIVDLLIQHGADVNFLDPASNADNRAVLLIATEEGRKNMVRKLLAAKADPNKSNPSLGITPLHSAVAGKDVELTKMLLDAGANPSLEINIEGMAEGTVGLAGKTFKGPASSFDIGIQIKSPEILKLLLQKADQQTIQNVFDQVAKSDWADGVKVLIAAGVDINKSPDMPYLLNAVGEGRLQIVTALLEAGADPNAKNPGIMAITPLDAAMFAKENGLQITELLIQHGAVPNEATLKSLAAGDPDQMPRPDLGVHDLLNHRFLIPQLIKNNAVTLLFGAPSRGAIELSKSTGNPGQSPASLPSLLLEGDQSIKWRVFNEGGITKKFPSNLTIWRRGEDGREQSASAFWSGSLHHDEFPPLEWGDVIEVSFDLDPKDPLVQHPFSISEWLPGDILWNLQKHISFPIKVTIDGKEREYQMRGDRFLFDPTNGEVPLKPALELAALLTNGRYGTPYGNISSRNSRTIAKGNVFVSRDGWPDIKLNYQANGLDALFKLKSGDHLTIPPVTYRNDDEKKYEEKEAIDLRRHEIRLQAKDLPASRAWTAYPTGLDENGITLVQAIAEVLSFRVRDTREPEPLIQRYAEQRARASSIEIGGPLWNNPDLSKIVIRRIKPSPDNSEEIINVDLAKIISRPEAEITVEDARKADVILRAGDIVEIPLRADEEGKVWTGLSPAERSFFTKALGGRIQVRSMEQNTVVHDLIYSAVDFIQTPAGKLPVAAADHDEGYSSMTVASMFGANGKITRNGREIPDMIFLRNGDQVQIEGRPGSQRRAIISPKPVANPPAFIPQPPLPAK
ncbi:MAG TPA: ankyrin repeat domain-containing protein, partial [Luteolibacter sp.]|nr:ankyrin repeat domain-containing protein [Luteolibacter sp.]